MKLLVGLGNPGSEYKNTRHNIGFSIIDNAADKLEIISEKNRFDSCIIEAKHSSNKVLLMKPQTFMNNSGVAVSKVVNFYKIPLENIIVFHDDIDLDFGKIKFKMGGGHGGHNGLRSIDQHIGKYYYRLRYGVGRPFDKAQVSSYVLGNFTADEKTKNIKIIDSIVCNLSLIIDGEYESFCVKVVQNLK